MAGQSQSRRLLGLVPALSRALHVGCRLEGGKVSAPSGLYNHKPPFLPFSHFLTDTHGRQHDYLRISISER